MIFKPKENQQTKSSGIQLKKSVKFVQIIELDSNIRLPLLVKLLYYPMIALPYRQKLWLAILCYFRNQNNGQNWFYLAFNFWSLNRSTIH